MPSLAKAAARMGRLICVDGSFDADGRAGAGMILRDDNGAINF
jgi:hypothetical protein